MNKFRLFLKESHETLNQPDKKIQLVLGNTSGDIDSIVGALGLAYYLSLKTKSMWVPIVNCKRDQLKLKVEIYAHIIEDCNLNLDHLVFWDDLTPLKNEVSNICLMDHNKMDAQQAAELGADSHSKVTLIYDHHVDNNAYPQE